MKKSIDAPLLLSLWGDQSVENRELAQRLGVPLSRLWEVRKKHGLPPRKHERKKPTVDPSPEEIAERCLAIRKRWSMEEESRRLVGRTSGWTPPACGPIAW